MAGTSIETTTPYFDIVVGLVIALVLAVSYAFYRLHKERRLRAALERQLAELTTRFDIANRDMETFSYAVSHDLRAPLRAIEGFSRIIEEDYRDRLDDDGREHLEIIVQSCRRMGTLFEDLLAFSRLDRRPFRSTLVDMTHLARQVANGLPPSVRDTVKIGSLPPTVGDQELLREVWSQLLANAVKFQRVGVPPQIDIGGESDGNEAFYYVKDNGVGFDMAYSHKLFGVFQRLHSVEEFPGNGIGLAIVRQIVMRHGGRVRAEAKTGESATFYFTLPAQSK